MRKQKISICLLIAFILGFLYLIYSGYYWGGTFSGMASLAEAIGSGIATALVMPHLIATYLAVIFNALGCFIKCRPLALVGVILYTVAMILFPVYFMFVIIQAILSYIGFGLMGKKAKAK